MQIGLLGVGALFGVSALVNFVAINETTLVNVGVIHALQPAVVAALAGRYLGERIDAKLLVWVSTAIGGAVLVAAASGGVGTWSLHGDLLAVLGLALNSTWFLAGRWVRTRTTIDATTYMLVVFGTGAATLLVISTVAGRSLSTELDHPLPRRDDRAVRHDRAHDRGLGPPLRPGRGVVAVHPQPAGPHRRPRVGGLRRALERCCTSSAAPIVLLSLGRIVMSTTGDEPPPTPPGELPDARDEELAG